MSKQPDDRRYKSGRRPSLRLESCTVEERFKSGGYRAKIRGFNLRPRISPPVVTIGGQLLQELEFAPDGRSIVGVLAGEPKGTDVVVDYGFMRSELTET